VLLLTGVTMLVEIVAGAAFNSMALFRGWLAHGLRICLPSA
jgi:hypothetical protein